MALSRNNQKTAQRRDPKATPQRHAGSVSPAARGYNSPLATPLRAPPLSPSDSESLVLSKNRPRTKALQNTDMWALLSSLPTKGDLSGIVAEIKQAVREEIDDIKQSAGVEN